MRRRLSCAALLAALLAVLSPAPSVLAQSYGDAAVNGLLTAANARTPIYALNFTSDPAAAVGSPRAFTWALSDPTDSATSQYHQGVVLLNGTTNSWVDLSTTSSVNSAGVALPVFGGNNGSYSFEVVFKLPAAITGSWPKVFFLGNGAGNDDVVMTFNGNVPGFTTMNLPLAFQIYNSPSTAAYHYAIRNFLKPVVVGQWYHVVVEVVSDPTVAFGGANWYVWVNGVQVAWSGTVLPSAPGALYTSFEGAAFVNNAANRTLSYLGKSEFNDANAGITIDAFRVYDYALPASLIPQLAAAYGVLNQAMQPNTSLTIPVSAEDTQALAALQGTKAPIFSASFGTNPATLPGLAQLNYVWNASDPTDLSSVASYHTGVVVLNGASTSYIDLSTVSGPQSCGQLLPIFGGAGSGTFGSTQGVTFEMVMKLTATETWSKVFDLASQGGGDGAYDIFGVSWDGNAGQTGQLEIQAYNGLNSTWTSAQPQVLSQLPFVTPTIGAWMHVAVVMTNTDPRLYSMGNWQVYVNGVPTANATGFNMPLPVYRPYAFLGASAWSDAPAPVTFDAFRIYDYTLTQAQVQRLAAVYGLSAAASASNATSGDAAVQGLLNAANARQPIYSLNFTQNPATVVGSPRAFNWAVADPLDQVNGVAAYHQGVVLLNGTTNSWVDLSTTSSVNSAGVALPVFGGNNGSYSFEVVFKLPAAITGSWPKVFFLGNGAGNDDVVMTFNGNVPGFTTMNLPLAFQIYNSPSTAAYHYAIRNFLKPVVVGQWYHVVVEVVSDPTVAFGGANWYVWVNGVQVAWSGTVLPSAPGALYTSFEGAAFVNNAANRTLSYLGKSEFNDANAGITIDAFRVYDYALPASLIPQLAAAYGVLNQAMQPNTSLTIPVSAEDTQALAALQGTKAPIFSASFGTNPATLPGLAQLNYVWNASDPTDLSSVASYHTGVVVLNGASTSYIDLSTVSGPQSCGQLLPIFGGAGSGTFGSTQGVTFEMVMKLTATETWSKVFDLASQGGGDGAYDIFGVSWDGNAGQTGQLEIQAYNGLNSTWTSAQPQVLSQLPFVTPTIGAWMHVAVVMTNTDPRLYSMGNWQVYVNGVPTANATGFNMPLPVYRPYAFLGASAWSDAPAPVTFDAFRIYDYTLTQAQVQRLAAVYGLSAAASASNATSGDAAVQGLLNAANARQPIYSLNFTQNPATVVGSPRAFNWAVADPLDQVNGVAAYHQGVVLLNGTTNSWVDLSTTSSVNSAGVALPVFGGNNGSYSFEVVFKLPAAITGSWPKVFFLGNGAGNDDVVMTFNGNVPGFTTMNLPLAFQIYNSPSTAAYHYAIRNFLKPVVVGQWYHVVVEVVSDPTVAFGGANWYVWVNGVQVAWSGTVLPSAPGALYTSFEGAAFVNNAANRTLSYLGKSEFNDANAGITIDAFRVYDYALPASLIPQLAAAYGVLNQAMQPNTSLTIPVSAEDTQALAALQGTKAPIFSASFGTNPATLPGLAQLNYVWNASDPTDLSSVASYHTGVVVLNGASTSYIDLSTVSGPQSCGQLLPIFGGAGSGTFGSTQGVTFEMVMKLTATETWSKVFDLASQGGGDGAYDIFGVSWDGNAGQTGQLEIQAYNGLNSTWTSAQPQVLSQLPFVTPTIGAWMHVAVVMTNTDPRLYSMGNWQVYVNGVPTANATGFNMPLPVYRPYAFLGASAWSDAPAPVTFDAFRIYDYTLTQAQVQRLAAVYGLSNVQTNASYSYPLSQEDIAANAAVPIPPVFRASFPSNPASVVGVPATTLNYQWVANDGSNHPGVVQLSGSSLSYIDLNTNAGTNSVGLVLPVIGGAGNYAYGQPNQGWTFETVVKFNGSSGNGVWEKAWFVGNGGAIDDISLSWDGDSGVGFGAQIYSNPTQFPAFRYSYAEFLKPQLNVWYHIVWSVTAVPAPGAAATNFTSGAGVWTVWVNGQLLNWAGQVNQGAPTPFYPNAINTPLQGAGYPQAVARPMSYIGKSEFGDPNDAIWLDAFRIYNYTLTTPQVQALANIYALNTGVANWPIPANAQVAAVPETTIHSGITQQPPVFNAVFGQNPATYVGATAYSWLPNDPTDSQAVQNYHKGLIVLNGSATSFVDVTQVTGPNSVGLALPMICTSGSGCSVELVVKLSKQMTWNKLFNFGAGGNSDSFTITWFSDNTTVVAQEYAKCGNTGSSAGCPTSSLSILAPTPNVWYHIGLTMTNTNTTTGPYTGTWMAYVNGVAAGTALTGALMPLPIYRPDSYIGGSDWTDAPIAAVFDALRVYNYPLQQSEMQGLAAAYGLAASQPGSSAAPARSGSSSASITSAPAAGATSTPARAATSTPAAAATSTPAALATSTPAATVTSAAAPAGQTSAAQQSPTSPIPAATSTIAPPGQTTGGGGSSSSSGLSNGAIAGIVIGAVVGALLICLLLGCLFFSAGRRKKLTGTDDHHGAPVGVGGTGGYSRSEESTTAPSHDIEMAEAHGEDEAQTVDE